MSVFDPKVKTGTAPKYKWPLSYYSRLTSRMGELVPVMCKKVIPGDRWRVGINAITRLAPLANPVYDRLRIDYDAFYVQNRILDKDWKSFITGGIGLAGEVSTEGMLDLTMTCATKLNSVRSAFGAGSLFDYLGFQFTSYDGADGLPAISADSAMRVNAYPVLAYNKIYSDWYRNERFQTNSFVELSNLIDGFRNIDIDDTTQEFISLRRRNYAKDPYTTCLSEPLIGGPVSIISNPEVQINRATPFGDNAKTVVVSSTGELQTGSDSQPVTLLGSLSSAASNTVQQLNEQYALYRFFMKDTYNGNRYNEYMEAHYDVYIPDSTLERTIFLGRQSSYVAFSEIFQTSGTTGEENTLGDYTGKGVSVTSGRLFDYNFIEHGHVFIIMSIVPFSTYFQGASDIFDINDRFGYFYPEFQNIGDDEVPLRRIWNDGTGYTSSAQNRDVFGFNRRWYDYIWFKDEIHGNYLMDKQLYNWTFARKFATKPILGDVFSTVPTINNPFYFVADESQNFYTDIYFDIDALRPVERYETITTH